jgi:hypothetical protein
MGLPIKRAGESQWHAPSTAKDALWPQIVSVINGAQRAPSSAKQGKPFTRGFILTACVNPEIVVRILSESVILEGLVRDGGSQSLQPQPEI